MALDSAFKGRTRFVFCLQVCLVFFLTAARALSQDKLSVLQGTISDESDAVLPGASVRATNLSNGRVFTATTGPYGNFVLRNLEPGRYTLLVELSGFSRIEYSDIDILLAQTLRVDATLKAGGPATTVQVTGASTLVDTESTAIAFQIPKDQLEKLPNGRTFQSFALMAPGTGTGDIEGGIQIHGASGAENAFTIDGIETTSPIDRRSRQNAPIEYIQEIQIATGGTDAQYRGALGGTISATTRSGGSELHGEAWVYYSGSALEASPARRLVPGAGNGAGYFQDDKDGKRAIEPGFSLGGPLFSGNLFFFTSWSPRWNRQDSVYRFGGGAESGSIRREQTWMSGFNKVSWEPSSQVRGYFSWLWTPSKSRGTFPVYDAACPNCVLSSQAENAAAPSRGFFNTQSSYNWGADIAFSKAVTLGAHAGYFWDNYKDTGVPELASVQYLTPASAPLVPANEQQDDGFQTTPRLLRTDHDRVARTSAGVDLGILSSSHDVKGGFSVEKTVNDVLRYYPGGYVLVSWDRSFQNPITGLQDRGAYGYYEVNDFRTQGSAAGLLQSAYVQDRWRVLDRLTVNAGFRAERERIPSFRRDIREIAIDFGWKQRMAPRIGAAYDLRGDGTLKIQASAGRYYDWTKFALSRTVFGGELWRTYYRSLDSSDVSSLSLDNMPGRNLWTPGGAFRDRRNAGAGLLSVDPDLKPMAQDQWSVGVDYQLPTRTLLSVRYLHQGLKTAVEDLLVRFQGTDAYIFANPGEGIAASAPFTTGRTQLPLPYPKPERTYDAVDVSLRGRFWNRLSADIAYTWSRLYGNYTGIANSDDLLTPTTGLSFPAAQQASGTIGSPAGNANRGWDLDELLFDSKGRLDTRGPLPTDRPHVVKINGTYDLGLGAAGTTTLGAFFYAGSGTPLTTQVSTTNNAVVFVNGRGDMGRTPLLSTTDVQFRHTVGVGEGRFLRFELNVLNAFNQKTARHRFDYLNRRFDPRIAGVPLATSAINLTQTDLRAGYDYSALIAATPDGADAFDPRYGQEDLFSEGVSARIGIKFGF